MLVVLVVLLWLTLFLAFWPLVVASDQHRRRERERLQRWALVVGAGLAVVGLVMFFRRKNSSTVAVASSQSSST